MRRAGELTSADPDYFISHVDVTRIDEYRQEAARLAGEAALSLLFRRLSLSRLVTIAQIEGRVRGAGSEFVLACDMRFAARSRPSSASSSRASAPSRVPAGSSTSPGSWAGAGPSRSS